MLLVYYALELLRLRVNSNFIPEMSCLTRIKEKIIKSTEIKEMAEHISKTLSLVDLKILIMHCAYLKVFDINFLIIILFFCTVMVDHQAEIERLKESHRLYSDQLVAEQDEVIRQLEARHLSQLVSCPYKLFEMIFISLFIY